MEQNTAVNQASAPVNGSPGTALSDSNTVAFLRDFIRAEKPPGTTPVDVLQVIFLALRKTGDHAIYDSQQTLATGFCVDLKTIARSQKRLSSPKLNWINNTRRRGKTSALSLNLSNIPQAKSVLTNISPEARTFAAQYQHTLQNGVPSATGVKKRKKFPKGWLEQQFFSAQRILDECSGDVIVAAQMATYALFNAPVPIRRKSAMSLYHLITCWKQIRTGYNAYIQELQAHTVTKPIPPPQPEQSPAQWQQESQPRPEPEWKTIEREKARAMRERDLTKRAA